MKYPTISGLPLLFFVAGLAMAGDKGQSGAAVESLHVDTGAVVAAGAVRPVDGITSSGQPDSEALRVFAHSGYAAIIDLRGAGEERGLDEPGVVENLGMSYVPFPIESSDAVNYENASRLRKLVDDQKGPVLIHCRSGNRVGALLALVASLNGADDEQAIMVGKDGGLTGLEPVVRDRLAEKKAPD